MTSTPARALTAVRAQAGDGRVIIHIHDALTGDHIETLTGQEHAITDHLHAHHPGIEIEDLFQPTCK